MRDDIFQALAASVRPESVRHEEPLAPLTTFKVGGPAEWLVETRSADELMRVVAVARRFDLPLTILGGGSNLLVADKGVRGVVARVRGGEVRRQEPNIVTADAGVTINGLVRWTITHGLAGLESWAGTPGTIGGAIYGNAHFGSAMIGDLVSRVTVAARDGSVYEIDGAEMEFGYDTSRLQRTREILLTADFVVTHGESSALRRTARESLAFRKHTQPLHMPSAGCIFQNPDPRRDRLPADVPYSAGALVDRAGLKGARIGGALVSPGHANFIVNDGGATAADIRALIERCRAAVFERFGVQLKEEIVCIGEF